MALMACSASLCSPVDFFELDGLALAAQVHPRCLSRSLLVSLDYTVVTMGENVEARLLASTMFSCALMPFCEESSHWETGPYGTILVSGIGGRYRGCRHHCLRPRSRDVITEVRGKIENLRAQRGFLYQNRRSRKPKTGVWSAFLWFSPHFRIWPLATSRLRLKVAQKAVCSA